jgi:hypothetical protein
MKGLPAAALASLLIICSSSYQASAQTSSETTAECGRTIEADIVAIDHSFRLGAEDAAYIAREFDDRFTVGDLLNLENRHIYLKLMIDGQPSKPFSAASCPASEIEVPRWRST